MFYPSDRVMFPLGIPFNGTNGFIGRLDINNRLLDTVQIVTGFGARVTLSTNTEPVAIQLSETWSEFQLSMTTINDFGEFGGWMGPRGKPKPKDPIGGFLFWPSPEETVPRKLLDGNNSFPSDINSMGDACASTWLFHQTETESGGEMLSIVKHLNILNYTGPSGFDSQAVSERYRGTDFPRIVGAAVGGDIQGAFLLTPMDMP